MLVTQLCLTPWTVACQAPLSMGFSRQESKVGCHFLLQGIFLTQGLNPGLLHYRQILYRLSHQEDKCISKLFDLGNSLTGKKKIRQKGMKQKL